MFSSSPIPSCQGPIFANTKRRSRHWRRAGFGRSSGQFSDYRSELHERIATPENPQALFPSPNTIILKYLDRYGDRLFGHPTLRDEDNTLVAIVERTNNVLEHFFGDEKQHLRRRLGRANLGRDLENQPAQAALAANLRHPEYVRVLCGSLDNLPTAFADLDNQALEKAGPLSPKQS